MIVLNHKCALKPTTKSVKEVKVHKLSQEFELMRRVVVEVKKSKNSTQNSLLLNFHPRLRKAPL